MKKSTKLQHEKSKLVQQLNELNRKDELTDEDRAAMDAGADRLTEIEVELRSALIEEDAAEEEARAEADRGREAGAEPDPETRERLELRGKVNIGQYAAAAIEGRGVDGAEAEYNAALGLKAAGAFPLELLAPVEVRATTNVDGQANQQTWLDRLFSETAASRLGITMRSVAAGTASFPVTTAGASAAQRGRGEAAADAAWTVGVTELKPSRNAVRAIFSEEDAMRLPGLEDGLRRDLGMALAEGVDRAIFLGDDGANENPGDITGLTTAANIVEKTISQANKVKGPESLVAFVELVDGKHAAGLDQLNCVLAVGAHTLWATTIHNSAADNQTVLEFLKQAGLMCSVRGDIEAATDDADWGAFVGRARGIEGAGVAAIWDAGMLIRDPYSGAAKGEVGLTLSYFWNLGFPRPTNFARVKFGA